MVSAYLSRVNNWPALSEIIEAERGLGGGTCRLGAALSEITEADRGLGGGTWILLLGTAFYTGRSGLAGPAIGG